MQEMAATTVGTGMFMRAVGEAAKERPVIVNYYGAYRMQVLTEHAGPVSIQGSGATMAWPFMSSLRQMLFPTGLPNIDEGVLAAYWTLKEVIATNAGGGVGGEPDLVSLRQDTEGKWKARLLDQNEIEQVQRSFDELRKSIKTAFSTIAAPIPALSNAVHESIKCAADEGVAEPVKGAEVGSGPLLK
jgi:hypothetical protein